MYTHGSSRILQSQWRRAAGGGLHSSRARPMSRPFRANDPLARNPGRCPGLVCHAPSGLWPRWPQAASIIVPAPHRSGRTGGRGFSRSARSARLKPRPPVGTGHRAAGAMIEAPQALAFGTRHHRGSRLRSFAFICGPIFFRLTLVARAAVSAIRWPPAMPRSPARAPVPWHRRRTPGALPARYR